MDGAISDMFFSRFTTWLHQRRDSWVITCFMIFVVHEFRIPSHRRIERFSTKPSCFGRCLVSDCVVLFLPFLESYDG